MFAVPRELPDGVPQVKTRKALIILSIQNDIFYIKDGFFITKNHDFLPRLKEMIPYFRKIGDIIWVKTIIGAAQSANAEDGDLASFEEACSKQSEENRKARRREESQLQDDTAIWAGGANATTELEDSTNLAMFFPSSKSKDLLTRTSSDVRAGRRVADSEAFDDTDATFHDQLTKPRKGQKAQFCVEGTPGAEIMDDFKSLMDEERDMVVVKYFYSAFDQTSLLTTLRMNLTTEIYLSGCFTNTGIYTTAADAVQHGLDVVVVEDCLGYRNEDKHDEAMRQMADIMGVQGTDSEEVIMESGGRDYPNPGTPGIPLGTLSISPALTRDQASLVNGSQSIPSHAPSTSGSSPTRTEEMQSPIHGRQYSSPTLQASVVPIDSSDLRSDSVGSNMSKFVGRKRSAALGQGDTIGSGDSRIMYDTIALDTTDDVFVQVKKEVAWQKMYHRRGEVPRLVAVQGNVENDGTIPIYRHPADESPPMLPFSSILQDIRRQVEQCVGQPFNHALLQLYRTGEDNISEHADKTLDMVPGSSVVNVSLGAARVMTFRTKKPGSARISENPGARQVQRVLMPHNSLLIVGPQTNREWLHGIRPDKRPHQEKTDGELSFGGERISITFRNISTFMNPQERTIWGSGATMKSRADAVPISTDAAEMKRMVLAFGNENQNSTFDWDAQYGNGFDVVDLVHGSSRLILCNDPVANLRVRLALSYKAVAHTVEQNKDPDASLSEFRFHPWSHGLANVEKPILKEADADGSEVEGDLGILVHLEKHFPSARLESVEGYTNSQLFRCAAQSNELLYMWREFQANAPVPTRRFHLERPTASRSHFFSEIIHLVQSWEDYLQQGDLSFVAGKTWTILDCAFWPVVHELLRQQSDVSQHPLPRLREYHRRGLQKKEIAESSQPI